MILKKIKRGETRRADVCSARDCKSEDTVGYAAGVAFPESVGDVWLCPYHAQALDNTQAAAEEKAEAPKAIEKEEALAVPGDEATLKAAGQEASEILDMVKEYTIVTQEDMDFANECLTEIKGRLKALKKTKEEVTKPMNEALAKFRNWFRPAETFFGMAEKVWKDKMAAFVRVQQETQRQALLAVQAAHQDADVQGVAQEMTRAVQAEVMLPSNISVTKRWAFAVEDISALPEEYLKVVADEDKIESAVQASDGKVTIPGVRIFPDDIVTSRSR